MFHLYNFNQLPFELSLRIYRNVQHNSVNYIIKLWYKYISKKTHAVNLMLKITDNLSFRTTNNYYNNNILHIDCFNPFVEHTMKYCSNILKGTEDKDWWLKKLRLIGNSIYSSYSEFNHSSYLKQNTYLNICMFYKKINDKFIQNNTSNLPNNIIPIMNWLHPNSIITNTVNNIIQNYDNYILHS